MWLYEIFYTYWLVFTIATLPLLAWVICETEEQDKKKMEKMTE